MNTPTQHIDLRQFTGSERLYRILPRLVIDEGVQYLADQTRCYWLLSAIYSHLVTVDVCSEFVVATLTASDQCPELSLDDGNVDSYVISALTTRTSHPATSMSIAAYKTLGNSPNL